MCLHKWVVKVMACGHEEANRERDHCEEFDPTLPGRCPFLREGYPETEPQPYTPGDGDCRRCVAGRTANDRWLRAAGRVLGIEHEYRTWLAVYARREYLFRLDFVAPEDALDIQDLLIQRWISSGEALDIDDVLRKTGYHIPEHLGFVEDSSVAPESEHEDIIESIEADVEMTDAPALEETVEYKIKSEDTDGE
ncbi:hypothetical protein GGR54DRAFT_345709 [Hypoxylon sp. NC1633]|nr:hypothetical protein GGR54DRAFT_345709 [Hypoxylon sp. NC1633]